MEAQELLKKYNDLFKEFLLATNIFAEIKVYLKMKKVSKQLKKLNKSLVYNAEQNCFEFEED